MRLLLSLTVLSVLTAAVTAQGSCELQPIFDRECIGVCKFYGINGDTQNPGEAAGSFMAAQAIAHADDCVKFKLEIRDSAFPGSVIGPNWLVGSGIPPLYSVGLYSVQLSAISSGAFSQPEMAGNLRELHIYGNPMLDSMASGITSGLTSLDTYEWVNNAQIIRLDSDVLAPFSSTLLILSINACGWASADVVANLTGFCTTGNLPNVLTLDLGFNTGPGFQVLSDKHLNKLNAVTSLFLGGGDIAYMENNLVLDSIADTLTVLNLAGNKLSTLPTGFLDSIIARNKTRFSIALQGNPWDCDCNLQWLQEVVLFGTGNVFLQDEPLCATPASEAGKTFIEANFQAECDQAPSVPPLDIIC